MLDTRRPVLLLSGDCHSIVLNRRAMSVYRDFLQRDPPGGRVIRDSQGRPTGVVEDGLAMSMYDLHSAQGPRAAAETLRKAFSALNAQGVTAVMDARATDEALDAAVRLWEINDLTVRLSGAWEITPSDCPGPEAAPGALSDADRRMARYRRGPGGPDPGTAAWPDPFTRPGIALRHVKMFVDGMPGNGTAFLRRPYLAVPGPNGRLAPPDPDRAAGLCYFQAQTLAAIFRAAADYGLHPHCHAIADGALDLVLEAAQALRSSRPGLDLRPAAAHLDLVARDQYPRMRELGVAAVLSFQWAALAGEDLAEILGMYGEDRFSGAETHGRFLDAGVTVGYGSDWPVEPLDQWDNFQAGALRRIPAGAGAAFPRLASDRDLTVPELLFAATRGSAWIMGQETCCGSLAEGRPADLAVLDGPLLSREPASLKDTRVLRTLVGGRTVWRTD
jgi:predicted amidohydrolase YtcJ